MNKLRGKAGEVLDKSLEVISKSSKIYSSNGDISSDQDNEQTYSEKMDVIYSNATDTVISNKGSSTSRSLSISNTKARLFCSAKKRPKSFARPQDAWTWKLGGYFEGPLLDFHTSRTPNTLAK